MAAAVLAHDTRNTAGWDGMRLVCLGSEKRHGSRRKERGEKKKKEKERKKEGNSQWKAVTTGCGDAVLHPAEGMPEL